MNILKKAFRYLAENKIHAAIILLGSALILITTIFDGVYGCTKAGCGFIIGTNLNDTPWFLSISNVSFNTLPFQMPTYAGGELRAYHILPNLVVHILSFSGISGFAWFYQILPVVFVIGLSILVILYGKSQKKSPAFTTFLLFFAFFGTHLSYLFSFIREGKINTTWGMTPLFQASRVWESPHFAFSILIFLATLILLSKYTNKKRAYLAIAALLFLEVGTKMYAGVLLFGAVMLNELITLIRNRSYKTSIWHMALFSIAFFVSVVAFFNPFSGDKSVFVFAPFSIVHHMIEDTRFFYSSDMVNARYFLQNTGFSPRLLAIEGLSTFFFVLYYFGIRILGLAYWAYKIVTKKITQLDFVLGVTALTSVLISIGFVQQGAWYNIIQFSPYGAFISGILTAQLFYALWQTKKIIVRGLVLALLLITIPASLVQFNYLNNPARFVFPKEEIITLEHLKSLPKGVVFAPVDKDDNAYVAAFSHQQTYVNAVQQVDNSKFDFQTRFKYVQDFENIDPGSLPIRYIYIPNTLEDRDVLINKVNESKAYTKIYEHKGVLIFQKK